MGLALSFTSNAMADETTSTLKFDALMQKEALFTYVAKACGVKGVEEYRIKVAASIASQYKYKEDYIIELLANLDGADEKNELDEKIADKLCANSAAIEKIIAAE